MFVFTFFLYTFLYYLIYDEKLLNHNPLISLSSPAFPRNSILGCDEAAMPDGCIRQTVGTSPLN